MLPEEPVRGGSVVAPRSVEVETGDEEAAGGIAVHLEVCTVDQQLREAGLQRQQRMRRQRRQHARQAQRRLCLRVEQCHVLQLDGRHQAARSDPNRANAHRLSDELCGLPFDGTAPLIDVRQNEPVRSRPSQDQQAPSSYQQQAHTLQYANQKPGQRQSGARRQNGNVDFLDRHGWVRAPCKAGSDERNQRGGLRGLHDALDILKNPSVHVEAI